MRKEEIKRILIINSSFITLFGRTLLEAFKKRDSMKT